MWFSFTLGNLSKMWQQYKNYFRPHDFVSSELLKKLDKKNNPGINEFPCKIIAISMDSYEVIQDWIKKTPELKHFDVPMLSDKENDLAGQFGCLFGEQMDGEDHPGPGYCANAVFIDFIDWRKWSCALPFCVGCKAGAWFGWNCQASEGSKGLKATG